MLLMALGALPALYPGLSEGLVPLLYAPPGIAIGLLLSSARPAWPTIAVGAALAALVARAGDPGPATALLAVASVGHVALALWVIRRWLPAAGGGPRTRRDSALVLACAGPLAGAVVPGVLLLSTAPSPDGAWTWQLWQGYAGSVAGATLGTSLALLVGERRGERESRRRRGAAYAALAFGLLVTTALIEGVAKDELEHALARTRAEGQQVLEVLAQRLARERATQEAIAEFIGSAGGVTPAAFRRVAALQLGVASLARAWLPAGSLGADFPVAPGSERIVLDLSRPGALPRVIRAADAADTATGRDLAQALERLTRRGVLRTAADLGTPILSRPYQRGDGRRTVTLVTPVYRGARRPRTDSQRVRTLSGFVAAVFDVSRLLAPPEYPSSAKAALWVTDVTADPWPVAGTAQRAGAATTHEIDFADRRWRLHYSAPAMAATPRHVAPYAALLVAASLAALCAFAALLATGSRLQARTLQRVINGFGDDRLFIADARGNLCTAGAQLRRTLGRHDHELLGTSLGRVFNTRDLRLHDRLLDNMLRTAAGHPHSFSHEVLANRDDGTSLPLHLTFSGIRVGGEHYFVATVRGNTDELRRRNVIDMLQRIATSANRARHAHEALRIGIDEVCAAMLWPVGHALEVGDGVLRSARLWRLPRDSSCGDFVRASETYVFRFGEGLPGIVAQNQRAHWIRDVLPTTRLPRAAVAAGCGLQAAVALPVVVDGRTRAVLEFFAYEPFALDAEVLDVLGHVGTLISRVYERNDALDALEHSRVRLTTAIENMTDSFALWDKDDRLVMWNGHFAKRFSRCSDLLHPGVSHRELMHAALHRGQYALHGKSPEQWLGEDDVKRSQESVRELELDDGRWLRIGMRRYEGGETVTIGTDVTALKHREIELVRSNTELQNFAYVASHDLQEPLRKIRAFGSRLVENYADQLPERARDYVERMGAAAERMSTLVSDLLTLSRVATERRPEREVDLNRTLAGVLSDLELQLAESDARLEVGDLPRVPGDPSQLRQVLQNLIGNALKYRAPGRIPHVTIDVELDGRFAHLRVADNGIGFDPDAGKRIFEVFQRLHGRAAYEGTGVGLAIVRKIVEQHGGQAHAEGRPGEGATFTVTLPLVAPARAGSP